MICFQASILITCTLSWFEQRKKLTPLENGFQASLGFGDSILKCMVEKVLGFVQLGGAVTLLDIPGGENIVVKEF